MKHCSESIQCLMIYKMKCVHCNAINHITQDWDARKDFEEMKCWKCNQYSLTTEMLLDMYPKYPDETVGGDTLDGKPFPDME